MYSSAVVDLFARCRQADNSFFNDCLSYYVPVHIDESDVVFQLIGGHQRFWMSRLEYESSFPGSGGVYYAREYRLFLPVPNFASEKPVLSSYTEVIRDVEFISDASALVQAQAVFAGWKKFCFPMRRRLVIHYGDDAVSAYIYGNGLSSSFCSRGFLDEGTPELERNNSCEVESPSDGDEILDIDDDPRGEDRGQSDYEPPDSSYWELYDSDTNRDMSDDDDYELACGIEP